MLTLPPSVRLFVCTQPTDMRRGFDGLSIMVEKILKQDPFSGHLFVFRNRRQDRIKVLYWDRDGYAIWYKRLEKGTFSWPDHISDNAAMEYRELTMMLEGITVSARRKKTRFALKK
jgi:transposase